MKISLKNIYKIAVFTVLCSFIFGMSYAQINSQPQKSEFWEHVRFGGGIGLSFGNNIFSGTIAPSALYDVNETVTVFFEGINITEEELTRRGRLSEHFVQQVNDGARYAVGVRANF